MSTLIKTKEIELDQRSKDLRATVLKMAFAANRGHVASAFSLIEIVRVLYDDVLKFKSDQPFWNDRDRFVLSKGHGCLGHYALLYDKGFLKEKDLNDFCKSEGILGGHPEYAKVPGVEASTGSLGHGLSIAVGMALAGKMDGKKHKVFALIGDGESNEGSIWEAALSASKLGLDNLTALTDYNRQQSYSTTEEVLDLEPIVDKWESFGFETFAVNGHDVTALRDILLSENKSGKPRMVVCYTIKGKGISFVEKNLKWHHKNKFADEEKELLLKELNQEGSSL